MVQNRITEFDRTAAKSSCVRERTRLVMHNLRAYCTLHCMCMITSGCNWGAAGEVEAIGTGRNQGAAADWDVIREQQVKGIQSVSGS